MLCGVHDQQRALRELRRVLRPGGQLLFIEHVRSGDPRQARSQDRMNGLNRFVVGCDCNRPTLDTSARLQLLIVAPLQKIHVIEPYVAGRSSPIRARPPGRSANASPRSASGQQSGRAARGPLRVEYKPAFCASARVRDYEADDLRDGADAD